MIENYGLPGPMGADFSECGAYRFLLWRIWDDRRPPLGAIMLNPSTADAIKDDPTVARCGNRARRLQHGGVIVGNLYGFRATDPRKMKAAEDPVGPHNDPHLRMIGTLCPTILLAWGSHAEKGRAQLVIEMLRSHPSKPKLLHLGLTKDGHPRHPLYVGYETPYQEIA